MVILDTLSRRPDLCQEENDNNDMMLLPDTLFVGAVDLALKDLLATAGQNDSITSNALRAPGPSHIHPGGLDGGGRPHNLQRTMLRTRQLRS